MGLGEGLGVTYVCRWWWGVWGGDIGCNQGVWLCCTDILAIRISISDSSILTCILHVQSGHPSPYLAWHIQAYFIRGK